MRKRWRPEMPALLPPARMRQCSGLSRSFLRGPAGPRGASTWTSPALWRSYRAKETAGQNKIRITKVSTLPGEPRTNRRYAWRAVDYADPFRGLIMVILRTWRRVACAVPELSNVEKWLPRSANTRGALWLGLAGACR